MKQLSTVVGVLLLVLSAIFYFIQWYALIPAFIVLGIAIITRKALEPLIVGTTVGFLMLPFYGLPEKVKEIFPTPDGEGLSFPFNMLSGLEDTIARGIHEYGLIWVGLVCILYGAFVQLLVASGGISALVDYSKRFVKSKKDSLIMTYIVTILFFIDDYLNALASGNIMHAVTDKFKVSREKLAMVMSFVVVPITIIIPISTWTIFYGAQLTALEGTADWVASDNPVTAFMNTIPYNFSAIVSLVIGALIVLNILPDTKRIKEFEAIAEKSGYSDSSESNVKGKLVNFALPLFILILFSVFAYPTEWGTGYVFADNVDALRGITTALVLTYVFYLVTGAMKFQDISNNFVKGLETITFVLAILGFTYLLKDIQTTLDFDNFVAGKLQGVLNPNLLPMVVFAVVAVICWASGSNWGIYAILVPVTALLAVTTGANFWLTQGALASGTVWGAAACFFSDNRVLTAQSTKTEMMEHGLSQFPYQMAIFVISCILYVIAGYIL